jgi:hypothetical protein
MLYCVATIDFCGALHGRRADSRVLTIMQFITQSLIALNYTFEYADFIMNLFRLDVVVTTLL